MLRLLGSLIFMDFIKLDLVKMDIYSPIATFKKIIRNLLLI